MVSESFRSVPHGAFGSSAMTTQVTTSTTNGPISERDIAAARAELSARRVCGLLLVDDRTASGIRSSFRRPSPHRQQQQFESSGSSSSSSPPTSVRRPNGLVLGSIVIERLDITADDLRRAVIAQVIGTPKQFIFLSKDGWPLLRGQESRVIASNIISETNCILIKKDFDKPRVGVISASGDAVGFVFCDYVAPVKDFRDTVDELLRESRPTTFERPSLVEYRFFDKNGWPIVSSQEEKLLVLDLVSNQNAVIQFKFERKPELIGIRDNVDNALRERRGDGSVTDAKYLLESERKYALSERPSVGHDVEPFKSNALESADTIDTSADAALRRRGSKKNSSNTPSIWNRQTSRRKTTKDGDKFRSLSKSSKAIAKPIMLSYARQEAAQHALDLKEELLKLGFQVYLDVHEIQTGTDWQDSLNEAVSNCYVFVPLVTPMYGKTQWTNREVKLADLLNKRIVPINFLDHWPPECLAIQFATTQYVTWRPEESEHNGPVSEKSLVDIKFWPHIFVKRCAKRIGDHVPSGVVTKFTKSVKFSTMSIKQKVETTVSNESKTSDQPDSGNSQLVVISAHPQQWALVNQVRTCLEEDGFQVWCSTDIPSMTGGDEQLPSSSPVTPTTQLPTITEDKEISPILSETYKAIARRIVESKQRPMSLPPIDVSNNSMVPYDSSPTSGFPPPKRTLSRMVSQISDITHLSSLTPEKVDRLRTFQDKVSSCGVVIIIVSEAYFKSRTSQQHVYYCEHRKKVVIVKTDLSRPPCWFTMLIGNEQSVSAKNNRFMEVIRGCVKRILDPFSTLQTVDDLHESKMQYLVRNMKKNLPYLGTCVYIAGSTSLTNARSIAICKAIGTALAEVKNVTLVTSGFNGVPDLVAHAFKEALEADKNPNEANEELQSRIVHVLPVKDEQDFSDRCNQGADGIFEPKPYGKTLFLGESVSEREATLARLLDTCILIEGGQATAREVEEFIWNDHVCIPVISTGGAASGDFKVPLKIFECPHGVTERDWRVLSNKEASPAEVAKAVVHIVVHIKQNIALQAAQRLDMSKTKVAASKFKAKLRRSSKKNRPSEKLDIDKATATPAGEEKTPPSPDKVLPMNPIDSISQANGDKGQLPVKEGKWKKMGRLMTFSKKC